MKIPRHLLRKAVILLALTGAVAGCASYSRAVDSISGIAKATAATVDILKGPGEDVAEVWSTVFSTGEPVK